MLKLVEFVLNSRFPSLSHSLTHSHILIFLGGDYVFGLGQCNVLCFGISLNMQLINCFAKILVLLRRSYESAVVIKRSF